MKAEQIDQALRQKFLTEDERLVFWHDTNAEFADYVAGGLAGRIAEVSVLEVAAVGGLPAKLLLEREDPTGKYLVYSRGEAPPVEEDWLYDIRLYSAQFYADVASLWLQELELSRLSLRDHLRARESFLGSQDRRKKLKRLVGAEDDEAALDLKMMAVLVGSQVAGVFDVIRGLLHGHAKDGRFPLDEAPELIGVFDKMGLLNSFWDEVRRAFAYSTDTPSVAGLLRGLFISDLIHQAGEAGLETLAHHRLPPAGRRNAVVFLTHWRDSSGQAATYDAAAAAVAEEQNLAGVLGSLELETIKEVYTFWDTERKVVSRLKELILEERQAVDARAIRVLVGERRAGHWLSGPGRDQPEREAVADAYSAIVAAAELFSLHGEHGRALAFEAPEDLLLAYQRDLHRFDRLYRSFCTGAKTVQRQGWELLKTLSIEVEALYDQGFLQPLGVEWSRLLDAAFLNEWSLPSLPSQQGFYSNKIRPHLAKSERARAFVIISDAFRYEAAVELTEELNGVYRMDASLAAMLGVLPSYTALGMASLLPHEELAYSAKGDVLADGRSTSGTVARDKVLAKVQGMACQAKELTAMKKEDARRFTDGKRVVYIYHNVVDAMGDSAPTESETFEAVAGCIQELAEIVQFCVNTLNASKVWVTADHGFLYQQEAPGETDKSELSHKPPHAVKTKKRYVIGQDLGKSPEAHSGSTEVTAGAAGGMEFWVPRGTNRFHFTGGARFVHGGAMPQEVLVPVVTVAHVRGKAAKEASRSEKVSIQVLGTNHRITTPKYRFEIIQTEAVGDRRKPLTVRAAVYDGAQVVTSVEAVTFDSASDKMEDRKKSVRLELRTGTFDKATPYLLVLRDAESEAEVLSVPVVIDRNFEDDF